MSSPSPEAARLKVLDGELTGQVFEIDAEFTIGRDVTNNLCLRSPTASRNHARIFRTGKDYHMKDLGSHNGTYVNDLRITETRIKDGDVLLVGDVHFRFKLPRSEWDKSASKVTFSKSTDSLLEVTSIPPDVTLVFNRPPREGVDETVRLRRRYEALFRTNTAMLGAAGLHDLFAKVLDSLLELFPCENAGVLLESPQQDAPELAAAKSRDNKAKTIDISQTIVSRAVKGGVGVITSDALGDDRFSEAESLMRLQIRSAMCAPLVREGRVLGAVYLDARSVTNVFSREDLETLCALCGPMAVVVENMLQLEEIRAKGEELERSYEQTVTALANAIEARDHYTVGHTWRVTHFATALAKQLGWSEEEIKHAELGGILHDVGKVGVDDGILRKPGALDDGEYDKMKLHPQIGARMIKGVEHLRPAVPYVLYHHERFGGGGYPEGLKAKDIPAQGRLMAIADAFDALTSNRPYQPAVPPAKAVERLLEGRGSHFDPDMLDAFVAVWESGAIRSVIQDYMASGLSVACPFCSTYVPIAAQAQPSDTFECPVCRRSVLLVKSETGYVGELE